MPSRNYRGEYDNYHKKTEQKKRRASRNTARSVMKTAGKVKKGDGKDVAHKNGNPKDNKKKNLTVKSKSTNRSFPRTSKAKKVNRRS
jgi:spore germination protein GerM